MNVFLVAYNEASIHTPWLTEPPVCLDVTIPDSLEKLIWMKALVLE